jgi:hypothetical protein
MPGQTLQQEILPDGVPAASIGARIPTPRMPLDDMRKLIAGHPSAMESAAPVGVRPAQQRSSSRHPGRDQPVGSRLTRQHQCQIDQWRSTHPPFAPTTATTGD